MKSGPKPNPYTLRRTFHSEYDSWLHMKDRCLNSSNRDYHNYGARGISICKRWINSFRNFLEDMGPKPTGLTLERINNDGNYEQNNCKWATRKEQAQNTRKVHKSKQLKMDLF